MIQDMQLQFEEIGNKEIMVSTTLGRFSNVRSVYEPFTQKFYWVAHFSL
jgi:hypothetical protein